MQRKIKFRTYYFEMPEAWPRLYVAILRRFLIVNFYLIQAFDCQSAVFDKWGNNVVINCEAIIASPLAIIASPMTGKFENCITKILKIQY
jgi:hypothetical protein